MPPPPGSKRKKMGAGLALDRMVNARKSTYDPKLRKGAGLSSHASKAVRKYKKLKHRLQNDNGFREEKDEEEQGKQHNNATAATSSSSDDDDDDEHQQRDQRKSNKESKREQEVAEREAAAAEAQARKQRIEQSLKRRKETTKLHKKKTSRGQPVMKHQIHSLLDKIQKSVS